MANQGTSLKLLSWNVGGRRGTLAAQLAAVSRQEADLVCLQEITVKTAERWRSALESDGLVHVEDSAGRSSTRIFNLTACRWPIETLPTVPLPRPESLLSTLVNSSAGKVEVQNLHVPARKSGSTEKADTLAALKESIRHSTDVLRILCGDFNTPRPEVEGDELAGMRDVFTSGQAYGESGPTRSPAGFHRMAGNRLDHIWVSADIGIEFCDYIHGWRQQGLSDHSAMEAILEIPVDSAPSVLDQFEDSALDS